MPQNTLVGLIYETVEDPLAWNAFLTKFAEAVRAETVGLCTEDKGGQWIEILRRSAWIPQRESPMKNISFPVIRGRGGVTCLREMLKPESNSLATANW